MVVFFISSGIKIGIGHVKRCTQLALCLIKRGQEVLLCLENDFESLEIVKRNNLNTHILAENYIISEVVKRFPASKVIVTDLINLSSKETQKVKEYNSEIGILALDYFDMNDTNVDTIINLHNHNKEFSRPVDLSVKYFEGPMYGILRTEFDVFLNGKKADKNSLEKILITFGGSDPQRHTLSVLPLLDTIVSNFGIKLILVVGPNFIHKNEVLASVKEMKSIVEVVENPPSIASYMKMVDLCICGSGTTVIELAALGTPVILIPQSLEELEFARRFESEGFAIIAGSPDSIDKIILEESVKYYHTHPEKLAIIGAIGQSLSDGKGRDRIVGEIFNLNNKI